MGDDRGEGITQEVSRVEIDLAFGANDGHVPVVVSRNDEHVNRSLLR
ncbi:hypothetical protein GCM10009810_20390 [Nostocoides vanveenii]|uniref:Uncharacterized protein n=1 Tax=Nostocoides vanveenii TaxID=330835 RepID=A0ABN2KN52_9MICO